MTPWIQNVARIDIAKGNHPDPGENSVLIQITDPGMYFPKPAFSFKKVYQFSFYDVEKHDIIDGCSQDQADQLVEILRMAFAKRMNVIVHCTAGICRSGAVCEIGVMMGFTDTKAWRQPNLLVKELMMRRLGWWYSESGTGNLT